MNATDRFKIGREFPKIIKERRENVKRTLEEICEDLKTAKPGKEIRKLQKELKQYGIGLPMYDRYPDLPLHISIAALVM